MDKKRKKKNSKDVMDDLPPSGLRQPPPPPRRCSDGSVSSVHSKEGNTSIVRGKRIYLNSRTRPYYYRRCKKVALTSIESLPDELLWDILVCLPTDDLYDRARLVCRRWYHLIHSDAFVKQYSTNYGLVLTNRDSPLFYASVTKQGRIEVSELRCKRRSDTPAWSGCNGLCMNMSSRGFPYILNPATKQAFETAPFDSRSAYERGCYIGYAAASTFPFDRSVSERGCFIGYAADSMVYKLVRPQAHHFKAETYDPASWQRVVHHYLAVLSVGVDNAWRHVRVEHLPISAGGFHPCAPVITEGFMHWVLVQGQGQLPMEGKPCEKVLTLNVETEIISESVVPLPEAYLNSKTRKYYLSTGRYLSLLVYRQDLMWDVWEMKPETGEWRKVEFPYIEFKAQTYAQFQRSNDRDDCFIWPVGWVKYPEVLAFGVPCASSEIVTTIIFYSLHTHEIVSSAKLPGVFTHHNAFPHRNTLVWCS